MLFNRFALLTTITLALSALSADARGGEPFLIGQKVAGQIGGSLMNTRAEFDVTEPGKVRFKLIEASPVLSATFTIQTRSGVQVKRWSARPGKRFNKRVRFQTPGTYVLNIQSLSTAPAAFVLATSSKLGDPSKSVVATAFNGDVTISFLACKGENVSVAFLPYNWDIADHATVTGPMIRRPDGTMLFNYESESAYGNSITSAPIDQTGVWTVTYSNLPSTTDKALLRVEKHNATQSYLY